MDFSGLAIKKSSIQDVPLDLLVGIFSHLDIHDAARAKRVCRMWSDVVSGCWPLKHVEINCLLGQDRHTRYPAEHYVDVGLDSQEAKLDRMLHAALSARTKTLTLRNIALSHRRIILLIVNRLKEQKRKLSLLCFKDCVVGVEIALYPWQESIKYSWKNSSNLLLLTRHQVCDKVMLRSYTIKEVMHYPVMFSPILPFIRGMLGKGGSAGTISRLVVDCKKSDIYVFHSLLAALDFQWPCAGQDVRESVTAIHQQWVLRNDVDDNPDKWIAFRHVVNLFNYHICFDPDNWYKQYPPNHEDMKYLRIAHLNNMTIALLAIFFRAYEANY